MPSLRSKRKIRPVFKLWLEIDGKYVLGEGTFRLLDKIQMKASLSAAAKASNMSYRYAWGLVKSIEKHLGEPIVKTHKGGKLGGGAELTEAGLMLLAKYEKLKKSVADVCEI